MTTTNFPNGIKAPIYGSDGTLAADIVDLTDNSGGSAANTIAVIGGTYSQSEVANAVASLAAKINEINAVLQSAQITGS